MTRRRTAIAVLAAALIAGGVGALAAGLWIPAKAVIAQVLLERAWNRAQAGQDRAKPWPWANIAPLARLSVPRLGIDQIVMRDASGEALAFGPGHVPTTAAPGAPGTSIIAGHRDSHFRFLRRLARDDRIDLETAGGKILAFRVTGTAIVDARHYRPPGNGMEPALALVTCWPFDAIQPGGDARYVVYAALSSGDVR